MSHRSQDLNHEPLFVFQVGEGGKREAEGYIMQRIHNAKPAHSVTKVRSRCLPFERGKFGGKESLCYFRSQKPKKRFQRSTSH